MFARLSNLVLILSLLTAVAALVPRKPAAPVDSVVQSRQATRTSIFRKQLIKQARDGMKVAVKARGEAGEQPQTSSNPYPKCPDYKGLGYAHYPGWDYYANDVSLRIIPPEYHLTPAPQQPSIRQPEHRRELYRCLRGPRTGQQRGSARETNASARLS